MQLYREVAVGVVDHSPEGQVPSPESHFLPELPSGRLERGLPRLDLSPGELVEPPQQPIRGPTLDQKPVLMLEHHNRRTYMGAQGTSALGGNRPWVAEESKRAAVAAYGTGSAARRPRETDRLPELHDRLVERAGWLIVQERAEPGLLASAHAARPNVAAIRPPTRRYPLTVRLQGHDGNPEGKARHRPSDVRPETRQVLQLA